MYRCRCKICMLDIGIVFYELVCMIYMFFYVVIMDKVVLSLLIVVDCNIFLKN